MSRVDNRNPLVAAGGNLWAALPPAMATHALLALLVLVSLLAWPSVVAGADGAPTDQPSASLDGITMRARPAFQGVYRPGSWLPIAIDLENQGPDRQVELQAALRSGSRYATTVDLPNNARKRVTLYAYLPVSTRRINIHLRVDAVDLQTQELTLQPTANRARTVAVVTDGATAPRPPARLPDGSALTSVAFAPTELPTHALGLSSFDLLVLSDLPTADLSRDQLAALRAWVIRGGQLMIDGGPGAERTVSGLPVDLQPATIATNGTLPLVAIAPDVDAGDATVPLSVAEPTLNAAGRPAYRLPIAGLPVEARVIEQRYGRGAVGLSPLPLGNPVLLSSDATPRIWADLLEQTNALSFNAGAPDLTIDAFVEGNLANALTGLPALQFPSVGMLALLIGIYILVVGPGAYLVLRRFDRLALGWIVVPTVTLLFAGGAYAFGYAHRGGDVVLNQLTYIETFSDSAALTRVRSFVGLFSPTRRAYELETDFDGREPPLLRPISLQGPWDASLGGGSAVLVQPETGGAAVHDFDVAQWSMRALTSDTLIDTTPLRAQLTLDGASLRGTVENAGDQPLQDVVLVQGDQVARIGDLAPGETRQVAFDPEQGNRGNGKQAPGTTLSGLIYGDLIERSAQVGGTPPPAAVQLRIRMLDAIFAYGPNPRGGHPLLIGWAGTPTVDLLPLGLRAERQHLALIVGEPQLTIGTAPVELGVGWLDKRFTNAQGGLCYGSLGVGVGLGPEPALLQLALPRDLYGFQPTELALLSDTDGPWMAEMQVELYNWEQGAWIAMPTMERGEPTPISAPQQFVGSHGKLWARIAGQADDAAFGCVYLDATMKGTLP